MDYEIFEDSTTGGGMRTPVNPGTGLSHSENTPSMDYGKARAETAVEASPARTLSRQSTGFLSPPSRRPSTRLVAMQPVDNHRPLMGPEKQTAALRPSLAPAGRLSMARPSTAHATGQVELFEDEEESLGFSTILDVTMPSTHHSFGSTTGLLGKPSGVWDMPDFDPADRTELIGRASAIGGVLGPFTGDPYTSTNRELLLGAMRRHPQPMLVRSEVAAPELPAMPRLHTDDFSRRSKVPLKIPLVGFDGQWWNVFHCLQVYNDAAIYSVSPNPLGPEVLTAANTGEFNEACTDDLLKQSQLSAMKISPTCLLWDLYIMQQLKRRVSRAEHRRFILCKGNLHQYSHPNLSVLFVTYNPHMNLRQFVEKHCEGFFRERVIKEPLALYYTIEMLKALEQMHMAQIIHGDVCLESFIIRDFPLDSSFWADWSTDEADGWQYKGIQLTNYRQALDLRLYRDPHSALFTGGGALGEGFLRAQEGRPWTYHVDIYGACSTAYALLNTTVEPMAVQQTGGRWHCEKVRSPVWQAFFDKLLNFDSAKEVSVDVMIGARKLLERELSNAAARQILKTLLCGYAPYLH
eukprot:TRINITY_DN8049_c0_g1_i2.p1 TRINITY_DN8049_c0_g1~~TRINITY_DN8049_c0_g1_i2.p1  ORF type:complete len:578 (-),score=69.92 TRINITY_DN8049_c0_g1_i2:45-1778(-)